MNRKFLASAASLLCAAYASGLLFAAGEQPAADGAAIDTSLPLRGYVSLARVVDKNASDSESIAEAVKAIVADVKQKIA